MEEKENTPPQDALANELLMLQQQHQQLQTRYSALFSLNQLSQQCDDLSHFYLQVHRTIASLMTAKNFYIVSYDQTFSTLEFVYYIDEKDARPEGLIDYSDYKGSFTSLVIESMQPLLITPNVEKQLGQQGLLKSYGTLGIDWLGVPLLHNDLVIGVMVVQSYSEKTRYTEQDEEMLKFAGQHVVGAMTRLQDKERLTSAVNARTQELMAQIREREKSELLQESLYRISELANDASFDINIFYSKVHNIVGQLINATNFFIAKYDQEQDTIEYVYVVDEDSNLPENFFEKRKLSNHHSELVIRQQKTVLLTKTDMDELYQRGETQEPAANEHSWLGVPLIYAGKLLGVMVIQSYTNKTIYTQQDAELLNFVSNHVSAAIKRREISDIERQSHELLEQQGARGDMEKQAKSLGAKVAKSVTGKTTYLVTGEKVGETKINAAKDKGVQVLTEQEYLGLIG